MGEIAIRVEGVSKRYDLVGPTSVRRPLNERFVEVLRTAVGHRTWSAPEAFWALQDVSFEIKPGEVVGVIGRNGAGKSTLLKILSRVTEPTVGRVEIAGRIGSLLEVGTGFDPELSGRENIYLSGVILGMRKAEIDRKFDEIVAFSEVERFIDTPIKRYSSGMRVRLAFAVAAHFDPEILMLDEVLAVGDARFQKKCLTKMEDVGHQGRTVLFVSHNLPSIARMCSRTLLLESGWLRADGLSSVIIGDYLNSEEKTTAVRKWSSLAESPGGEYVRLRGVRVRTEQSEAAASVDIRQPVGVEVEYDVLQSGIVTLVNVELFNEQGIHAFGVQDTDPEWRQRPRPEGRYVSTVWIPGNFLAEGRFFVHVGLCRLNPLIAQHYELNAVSFYVEDSFEGDSARGDYHGSMGGVVRPLLPWHTRFVDPEMP